jgi:hypothetical protein
LSAIGFWECDQFLGGDWFLGVECDRFWVWEGDRFLGWSAIGFRGWGFGGAIGFVGGVEERNPTLFFSRQLIYAILDIKCQIKIG